MLFRAQRGIFSKIPHFATISGGDDSKRSTLLRERSEGPKPEEIDIFYYVQAWVE